MTDLVQRITDRVMRALLAPLAERVESQHEQVVSRIERLEKRLEAGLAKGQAEARLFASRAAAGRGTPPRFGSTIPPHAHELQAPGGPATGESIPAGIIELANYNVCGPHQ
jgi:hypothetical protein